MKVYSLGWAFAAFAASGLSAQTTTRCTTMGDTTNCETQSAPAPLDYGSILGTGRDLVPPIKPDAPYYEQPYVAPPKSRRPAVLAISTGNDLLAACEGGEPSCLIYIRGASEGFAVAFDVAGASRPFCLPDGVTTGQMQDIVVARMKSEPSERHWPAAAIIALSMMETFKCDK